MIGIIEAKLTLPRQRLLTVSAGQTLSLQDFYPVICPKTGTESKITLLDHMRWQKQKAKSTIKRLRDESQLEPTGREALTVVSGEQQGQEAGQAAQEQGEHAERSATHADKRHQQAGRL